MNRPLVFPSPCLSPLSFLAKVGTTTLAQEHYSYDDGNALGQKVTKTIYGGNAGAPNQVLVQYTDKMGNVVREGRMNGGIEEVTTYTYDYIGRKVEEKSARAYEAAWPVTYTTKWEYTWDSQISKQHNVNGQYISFAYENLSTGKVIRSRDYAGNESTAKYDDLDRLIFEQKPVVNVSGAVHYAKTEYYYSRNGVADNLATVKALINAPGEAEKWKITQNYYNNRGFLTSTAMLNDSGSYDTYSYSNDAVGRTRTMTDPLNRVTDTVYNDAQRKETCTDPLKQVETISYNASGLLVSKTDRNGIVHSWSYDGLGRELTYSAGGKQSSASYSWAGQLMAEGNETSMCTYQYDALGRMNYQKENSTDGTVEQAFTYFADNQRKTATLTVGGTGKITDYTYDRLGRLENVVADGQTAVYTYDVNGNRATLTVGDAVTSYSYNLANWLTSLDNEIAGQVQSGYTYTHNLDGNQRTKTDAVGGQTVSYLYSLQGRLIEEKYTGGVAGNGTVVYTYDKVGNRSIMTDTRGGMQTVTSYNYDANDRLKTTEKTLPDGITVTEKFSYDANGNQVSMAREMLQPNDSILVASVSFGGGVYEVSVYDAFGRLSSVQSNKGNADYTYNSTGLRHSKEVDGARSVHVWDGAQMVAEVVEGESTRYVHGSNLLWSVDKNSRKNTYLFNAHGDVVALSDESGALVREYSYDAFGNQLEQGKPIAWELVSATVDTNPFRYCGEYFDSETGSVYLRARYYNTANGRFSAEDSVHKLLQTMPNGEKLPDPLSLNLYTYCHNSPIMFVDSSGHGIDMAQAIYSPLAQAAAAFLIGVSAAIAVVKTAIVTSWIPIVAIAAVAIAIIAVIVVIDTVAHLQAVAERAKQWVDAKTSANTLKPEDLHNNTVYVIRDKGTNKVVYVGRTSDYGNRHYKHQRSPNAKYPTWEFTMYPVATGLTLSESRTLEQVLIMAYTLGALGNSINSIAKSKWGNFTYEFGRATNLISSFFDD